MCSVIDYFKDSRVRPPRSDLHHGTLEPRDLDFHNFGTACEPVRATGADGV